MDNFKLINDDCLKALDELEENSIDSIVTDPPYELNFMGKGWDNVGISFQKETWEKCLRVLKTGSYLLAFGGSRTFHRIACAIEDAGFEIRDTIMWLYGSGFPKSMNIGLALDKKNSVESKVIGQNQDILVKQAKDLREGHRKIVDSLNAEANERNNGFTSVSADVKEPVSEDGKKWKGWGTCLKPSFEPIIVARKPFKGSLVDNVIQYGVGGINIDECRVKPTQEYLDSKGNDKTKKSGNIYGFSNYDNLHIRANPNQLGRFPANTILTYDETDFDEVCDGFPNNKSHQNNVTQKSKMRFNVAHEGKGGNVDTSNSYNDSGSASRYFYCAKASKKDRDEGLEYLEYYALNEDIDENIKNYIKRLLNQ